MARRRSGAGPRFLRTINMLAFLPLASRGPTYGRLLLALAADPRVPGSRKALLGLAAAYVFSPVDLIPDRVPLLGALDDVAVVVLAVDLFLAGVPKSIIDEKLDQLGIPPDELERDLARVRRMVPQPVRQLAARLPDVLDGVAVAARRSGLEERVRQRVEQRLASADTRRRATSTRRRPNEMEEIPA